MPYFYSLKHYTNVRSQYNLLNIYNWIRMFFVKLKLPAKYNTLPVHWRKTFWRNEFSLLFHVRWEQYSKMTSSEEKMVSEKELQYQVAMNEIPKIQDKKKTADAKSHTSSSARRSTNPIP